VFRLLQALEHVVPYIFHLTLYPILLLLMALSAKSLLLSYV